MKIDVNDRFVHVRGASEHNLRDVDVDIPRDAMVAFTGVSGSGKSSLAFGTLYAEAQRRYFESVAPYARRLLQQVGAPHVQEITGLPAGRRPAAAARGAQLAVDGRHDHDAVEPAADALLARRDLPAGRRRGWTPRPSRRTPPPAPAHGATGWASCTTSPRTCSSRTRR